MKQQTFLLNTTSSNESDVLGIIAHITEEGVRHLQALEERAAQFTHHWSDGSVKNIAFELPAGVTVFGLDTGFEDEETIEIGDRVCQLLSDPVILSDDDAHRFKTTGFSNSRLVNVDDPLTAEDVCEISNDNLPEWSLGSFTVEISGNGGITFAAHFENTDGGEKTEKIELSKLDAFYST